MIKWKVVTENMKFGCSLSKTQFLLSTFGNIASSINLFKYLTVGWPNFRQDTQESGRTRSWARATQSLLNNASRIKIILLVHTNQQPVTRNYLFNHTSLRPLFMSHINPFLSVDFTRNLQNIFEAYVSVCLRRRVSQR